MPFATTTLVAAAIAAMAAPAMMLCDNKTWIAGDSFKWRWRGDDKRTWTPSKKEKRKTLCTNSNQMEVRMKLPDLIAACAILLCALASAAAAQDAAPGPNATGTVGAATRSKVDNAPDSRKDNLRKSDDSAGRKGVSCQRDTFFKGEDGQMHLCK